MINVYDISSDCEILYGVENLKNKILQSKIGITRGNKKRRCSNKRKSLTSSNNSSKTDFQKRNRVNYYLLIKCPDLI